VKILCITDPLTHPPGDATVALYNRLAEDRRFDFCHLEVSRVAADPVIPVLRITAPRSFQEFRELGSQPTVPARFTDFDLVFSRADKPYPADFLPALIRQEGRVRFVARPSSVRDCDVRAFYRRHVAHLLAPGIMTRSVPEACGFIRVTGPVVTKRNRSYGGKGVSRIRPEGRSWVLDRAAGDLDSDQSLEALVERLLATDPEPFEFVRYLPNVTAGDKQVLVVEGQIYGAYLRVARNGGWINNTTFGGTALAAEVTEAEAATIAQTCGIYHDRGLYALAYDFLQDDSGRWILSEINASGNMGGYGYVEAVTGTPVFPRLLDWLLELSSR
jgi:glutathione synthase/RimK-type ligase-like ATP-grasp enzyme